MFGRNRNERSDRNERSSSDRNSDRNFSSDRSSFDRDMDRSSERDTDRNSYEASRFGSGYSSEDRTYSMNDRDYNTPYSNRSDYSRGDSDRSEYGRSDFGRGGEYGYGRSEFGRSDRSRSGESFTGSRGFQGYEDYPGSRSGRRDFGSSDYGSNFSANSNMNRWNSPSESSSYGSTYGSYGSSYRGQPGLNQSNMNQGSWGQGYTGQGYRGYQDYGSSNNQFGTQTGQHRERGFFGKGPKGYKRSDEKIHDEVCDVLTTHYDIDASEIEVEVKDGTVTLTGTVESRHVKRMAEDIVADMNGVQDVRNNLRVMSHDSRQLESSSDGKSTYRSASSSTDSTLSGRTSSKNASSSTSTTRQ